MNFCVGSISFDVGVVEIVEASAEASAGKRSKKQCEIDFVVNKGSKKILYSICTECFRAVKT